MAEAGIAAYGTVIGVFITGTPRMYLYVWL